MRWIEWNLVHTILRCDQSLYRMEKVTSHRISWSDRESVLMWPSHRRKFLDFICNCPTRNQTCLKRVNWHRTEMVVPRSSLQIWKLVPQLEGKYLFSWSHVNISDLLRMRLVSTSWFWYCYVSSACIQCINRNIVRGPIPKFSPAKVMRWCGITHDTPRLAASDDR